MARCADPPVLTWTGMRQGARLALPAMPGLITYCLAFGASAANRGLSPGDTVGMSAIVFAGSSQMLSLELWQTHWSLLAVLTVAAVTATVNARFILMSASLQPWLRTAPRAQVAASLFFMADANWIIASRYRAEGGRDVGVLLGSGLIIWIAWVGATVPGYFAGSLVSEPKRLALDLVLPVFFAVFAVPMWRGLRRSGLPWAAAAVMAVAFQTLVPGYLFIVAGALTGALVAASLPPRA